MMWKEKFFLKEELRLLVLDRQASSRGGLWLEAMEEARAQALIPLVAPDSPEASVSTVRYIRILYAQDALVAAFRAAGPFDDEG